MRKNPLITSEIKRTLFFLRSAQDEVIYYRKLLRKLCKEKNIKIPKELPRKDSQITLF